MSIGLVLGCGGTLGMSWTLATLRELELRWDWDARAADVIVGTSAGAELAAMLGAGTSIEQLLAAQHGDPSAPQWIRDHLAAGPGRLPPLPRPRLGSLGLASRGLRREVAPLTAITGVLPIGSGDPSWLRRLADRCSGPDGWVTHANTWIVTADYDTGERVVFGRPDSTPISLADAVNASWAVPGWLAPVHAAGRRLVDGGIVSPASADLVEPLEFDTVVVVAPMASSHPGRPVGTLSRLERLARRSMTRTLDAEVRLLEDAGARVVRLEPNGRDLAAMGGNFMDARRRQACLVAARISAREGA